MIFQATGLSFPNIVAVLLLPIFIFPGLAGLKLRLYVARRSDSYGRIDTAAYSWTISSVSVVVLYAVLSISQGDLSLIPQFILQDGNGLITLGESNGTTKTVAPFRLFLFYVGHVGLCCMIGALYGVIAFNFLDDVRLLGRATNREYMLNQIMPGRRVDVRTKSGEIIRGKIPSSHKNNHNEGLLLINPDLTYDNTHSNTFEIKDIGDSLYISSEDISRITVVKTSDSEKDDRENVDPEQTVNNKDRVQTFILGLFEAIKPSLPGDASIDTLKRISPIWLIGSITVVGSSILSWFNAGSLRGSALFDLPIWIWAIMYILSSIIGIGLILYFLSQLYTRNVNYRIIIVTCMIWLSTFLYFGVIKNSGHQWLIFLEGLIAGFAGIAMGVLWTFATKKKRGFTGHSVAIFGLVSVLTAIAMSNSPAIESIYPVHWIWSGSLLLIFAAIVEGGPSRRAPWSKKIRIPLAMLFTILVIVVILAGIRELLITGSLSIHSIMIPLGGGFLTTLIGYLYEEQSPWLPKKFQ